jgi:hypothetical protein
VVDVTFANGFVEGMQLDPEYLQPDEMEVAHARNVDEVDLQLVGPDSDGCTPSDLAGMEGHEELAAWVATQETKSVQIAMTMEASFEPPKWLVEAPEGVAIDESSMLAVGRGTSDAYLYSRAQGYCRLT